METPDTPNRRRGRRLNRREPSLSRVLDSWVRQRAETMRNASRYGPPRTLPAGPPLSVAIRVHQPGAVVLTLTGQIDTVTSPLITAAIAQQLPGAPERVIIELARVTLLTPTGISQLVDAQLDGEAFRFRLVLVAPSDVVLQALTTSKAAGRFVIHSTIDDALRG
jgi:anti-sigma B factor antagonist